MEQSDKLQKQHQSCSVDMCSSSSNHSSCGVKEVTWQPSPPYVSLRQHVNVASERDTMLTVSSHSLALARHCCPGQCTRSKSTVPQSVDEE